MLALALTFLFIVAQIAPVVAQTPAPVASPAADDTPLPPTQLDRLDELAGALVDRMTPAQRVGQLLSLIHISEPTRPY